MTRARISREKIESLQKNIFNLSWPAIEPVDNFAWHRPNLRTATDSDVPWSSQALAISLFGWIKLLPQEQLDEVMNALIVGIGLEESCSWGIELEWQNSLNELKEKRTSLTQVDVLAKSQDYFVCIECKLKEGFGSCNQTKICGEPAQCTGNYVEQVNPRKPEIGVARCALTGKKIRYWSVIPEVFSFSAEQDHQPCPFAGGWYQLMRNSVLAYEVGRLEQRKPIFVLLYADGDPALFHAARFVASPNKSGWMSFLQTLLPGRLEVQAKSYQELLDILAAGCPSDVQGVIQRGLTS